MWSVKCAYCCTYQPGQNDDTALTNFLATAVGAAPNAAASTRYRKLFFEAHALSHLKSPSDRSESSEARILPLAGKMDRIRQQKDRLVGLSFTTQNEPSHSLVDRVCQQLEDNVVTCIELNRCSSRHDEALHSKVDTSLALDSSGVCDLVKNSGWTMST